MMAGRLAITNVALKAYDHAFGWKVLELNERRELVGELLNAVR